MQDLGHLIDDHDALDAMADQLISIARARAATAAQCRALLEALDARLVAHLTVEADFFHAASPTGRPDRFAAELARFEVEFSALEEGWRHYAAHWTTLAIKAEPARFAQETADILTALKLRIGRENAVLYPLALETGRMGLREVA